MAAISDRRAKARIAMAFLLLFVFAAALSVGIYYLGKLQENIAGQESRIALEAIDNATTIDEALARSPSNRFLKLIAIATSAPASGTTTAMSAPVLAIVIAMNEPASATTTRLVGNSRVRTGF